MRWKKKPELYSLGIQASVVNHASHLYGHCIWAVFRWFQSDFDGFLRVAQFSRSSKIYICQQGLETPYAFHQSCLTEMVTVRIWKISGLQRRVIFHTSLEWTELRSWAWLFPLANVVWFLGLCRPLRYSIRRKCRRNRGPKGLGWHFWVCRWCGVFGQRHGPNQDMGCILPHDGTLHWYVGWNLFHDHFSNLPRQQFFGHSAHSTRGPQGEWSLGQSCLHHSHAHFR